MSIRRCAIHGYWDDDFWVKCPTCVFEKGYEREEKTRKTFFGMTAVSWFLFLYIAVVLAAIVWVTTAHAGGDDFNFPLTPGVCQPHTSYDQKGWNMVEYTDLLKKIKERNEGKLILKQFPSLVCQVTVKERKVCTRLDEERSECITVKGNPDGQEVRFQWFWKRK